MLSLLAYCFLYYCVAGIGMVVVYHRCLSHKSLKLKKWFEYTLVLAVLPAGSPIQWVGNHRQHHAHADDEEDPHSPHVSGFWFAHNGWYINSSNPIVCFLFALAGPVRLIIDAYNRPINGKSFNELAKELMKDKFYLQLERKGLFRILLLLHLVIPFGLAFYLWSYLGILALWITMVFIYNIGDAVDSIAHLYGRQPYNQKNEARNNRLLAFLSFGDGWHADHHQFPASAKLGLENNGFDLAWQFIRLLRYLQIAEEVKVVRPEIVKNKLLLTDK